MGLILPPWYKRMGKANAVPGSVSYQTPGTYSLIIPEYNTLFVDVYGPGGGGGGAAYYFDQHNLATGGVQLGQGVGGSSGRFTGYTYFVGQNGSGGGYSQFYNPASGWAPTAYGGAGGAGLTWFNSSFQGFSPQLSAGGSASGGDANIAGGGAGPGVYGNTQSYSPQVGGWTWTYGNYGGYGGRAYKTFSPGMMPVGSACQIIVGQGGPPGSQYTNNVPTWGGNGIVNVSWS
jgi:hypothetical protein